MQKECKCGCEGGPNNRCCETHLCSQECRKYRGAVTSDPSEKKTASVSFFRFVFWGLFFFLAGAIISVKMEKDPLSATFKNKYCAFGSTIITCFANQVEFNRYMAGETSVSWVAEK